MPVRETVQELRPGVDLVQEDEQYYIVRGHLLLSREEHAPFDHGDWRIAGAVQDHLVSFDSVEEALTAWQKLPELFRGEGLTLRFTCA